MAEKVVRIDGSRRPGFGEPNAALVSMLEATLAKAKSGELQNLIGTGFVADGGRFTFWCEGHGDRDVYSMLGALAWLEHEYVDRVTGNWEPK